MYVHCTYSWYNVRTLYVQCPLGRFHKILDTIKRAVGFPEDPQASLAPAPSHAQARSLFQGVPRVAPTHHVAMPWDAMCHTTAKRDIKGLLDGSTKTLGEAVFQGKFPAAEENEKTIDPEAEKHFRVWVKKDFAAKKPFGSDSGSVLAAAEKLSVRLDERLASVNRLSGLLIQVQAFIHHTAATQADMLQRVREDAAVPAPPADADFDLAVVADVMDFAAYLTAAILRISLHIQAEVRMDRRARLVNHLRPDSGPPGIPSFTKRKLVELPLDTDSMFAGQFDQVLKETTSTQAVSFQASQITGGSTPLDLSGSFKIPKRPSQSKGQDLARKHSQRRVPEMTIVTDASFYGWGGHLGDQTASGIWQPQWKSKHINWLELQAVWLTLQQFLPQLSGTVVEVLFDNMTTVSYINKQGGTHSLLLCRLALDLWDWCDQHQITISAVHLAGENDVLADALSRGNYCLTEWTLHRPTLMPLWQVWDQSFVDMFALAKNAQLPVYYCLGTDPQASGSNAKTMNWDMIYGYAYPPIVLVPRVLRKMLRHPDCFVLAQPDLVQANDESPGRSAESDPGPLEPSEEFRDTVNQFFVEPTRLKLTAGRLSADQSLRRDFRRRWPTLPPRDAASLLGGLTVPMLHTSQDGALPEKWIPILPL